MIADPRQALPADCPSQRPTRLRFSLRLLFIVVTLSAVAIYWLLARPSVLANRFVSAVANHDYETAKSLMLNGDVWVFERRRRLSTSVDQIYAEHLPQDWSDIRACQRRLLLRVAYREEIDGRRVEWTHDSDIVARANGLEVVDSSSLETIEMPPAPPINVNPDQTLLP